MKSKIGDNSKLMKNNSQSVSSWVTYSVPSGKSSAYCTSPHDAKVPYVSLLELTKIE